MEIIRQTHPLDEFSRCSLPFFSEDSFFFDIETTGFLAQNSQLYMIGYGFIDNENLTIIQLFAESKNDEKNLLDTFFQFCENYTYMYSYNGDGFDVPYLKEKADMFHLPFKMKELISFDLLKQLRPLKNIFKLSHMKQRDMECFIGLQREDTYDGGQLIEVYKKYLINPSPDAKNNLLQHNYEDLTGLYQLISLKSFLLVFQCNFEFLSCRIEESINYSGITEKFLILTAEIPNAVPNAISYQVNDYYLTIYNKKLVLRAPLPAYFKADLEALGIGFKE